MRMDRAEIFDGARRRERLREALVGVERVRAERPVLLGNHMRNVIGIDPSHGRSCLHRERGRIEGEVGDLYFGVFGKSRRDPEHEHGGGKHRDLHVEAAHGADERASVLSDMARGLSPTRTETLVMPSTERSWSAGTVMGPGEGAVPGTGCGKQVERAVWKVILPSTFCTI